MHEARTVREPFRFRGGVRLLHELGVDVDADAANAGTAFDRFEDDAAVAGAEIDHGLAAARLGEVDHALHVLRVAPHERREALLGAGDERVPRGGGGHESQERAAVRHSSPPMIKVASMYTPSSR